MSFFGAVYLNAKWQMTRMPKRLPKAKRRALARAAAKNRRALKKSRRQLRDLGQARYRLAILALFRQKFGPGIFYPDTADEKIYIAELMNQEQVFIVHQGHKLFWKKHQPRVTSVTAEFLLETAIARTLERLNHDAKSKTEAPDPQTPSGETAG